MNPQPASRSLSARPFTRLAAARGWGLGARRILLRVGALSVGSLSIAMVGAAVGLSGCAASSMLVATGPVYPQDAVQQGVLDVQVLRRGTGIELSNTTGATLSGTLWVNRWWAMTLEPIAPGRTVTIPLARFVDRYDEAFRAGGFFATQQPTRLVHAQLQPSTELRLGGGDGVTVPAGALVGLVVIAEPE